MDFEQSDVLPLAELQSRAAQICRNTLQLDALPRLDDDITKLGGGSLDLKPLLTELERVFARKVDIEAFRANPTIEGICASLRDAAVKARGPAPQATPAAPDTTQGTGTIPPNGIPVACDAITPEMLPLVKLTPSDIARIVDTVPGGAANIQDIYPLTPTQEGILFHHRLNAGADPYLKAIVLAFDTYDHLQRYLAALQAVIDRHDILRTAILWEGLPEPVQVVLRQATLVVEKASIDADAGDVAQQLSQLLKQQLYRLDLRRAPPIHVLIAHDTQHSRWLALQRNHEISLDATSNLIMQQEIEAHLLDRAGQLLPPLPYRHFVAQMRQVDFEEDHKVFFQKMLGDVSEPTLPFGPADLWSDGSTLVEGRQLLDQSLAVRLQACARTNRASVASVFHLAWALALARLSGRQDVVFGTVLSGRMRSGSGGAPALGPFINILPFRTRLDDVSVLEGLRQAHVHLLQLLLHEHAPLTLVQRCSALAAPTPLLSSLFNYRRDAAVKANAPKAGIRQLDFHERNNFPLTLAVDQTGESFALTVRMTPGFDPQRVCAYVLTALERLADALENAPANPLAMLDVMPAGERRQLLAEWNDAATDYPSACAHKLFEAQAARTPEAVAVAFEDQQLTYAELNARANRLAHRLIEKGMGREVLVGICLERSPEMVIALLAILKAGGAYVPIDPMWPPERVRLVAEDACLAAVITRQDLADRLPPAVTGIFIGPRPDTDASEAAHNPELAVSPTDPIYVLYTSGTTRLPKGVLIEHRHLVQYVWAVMDRLHLEATGSYAMLQPLTVDSCHTTIFTALGGGGTLHLISKERALKAARLAEYFGRHRIDYLKIAPSHLAALLDQLPSAALLPSRVLIIGGEASHWDFIDRLWSLAPACAIWNHYGPTETTVGVSAYRLDPAGPRLSKAVPIGRPLPNTRLYVLDQKLQPVPPGLPGELCVGGNQVARGYLNRNTLTAEKFVPDPFSGGAGARLYRTGDLVRYLPDGSIEFLGRLDDQMKIRGFRIEPGEIEAVLCEHPAVHQAVVQAREDTPGDRRLVAYVVPADPAFGNAESLRALAREHLPDYMRPTAYVLLDRLPLSAHGKVERKALPAPDAQTCATGVYEAPVGETETMLAAIWAQVLRLDKIGRHDNFFELGGDSLLAVQVASRIYDRTKVDLPILTLFKSPTLASLAERFTIEDQPVSLDEAKSVDPKRFAIQQTANTSADVGPAPITRIYSDLYDIVRTWQGQKTTPASLIVSYNVSGRRQGLFWCLQAEHELKRLARQLGPDQPIHGMRSGHLIMEYTPENLDAIVQLYTAEMIDLQPDGPFVLGGNCQAAIIACAIAVQLRKLGRVVSLLILMESINFDFYDGPVALIFGRDSMFNPYRPNADPEAVTKAGFPLPYKPVENPDTVFRGTYPTGFTVDFVKGAHGEFFAAPNIENLAATLRKLLFDATDRQWILAHLNKAIASPFKRLLPWRPRGPLKPAATWSDILTVLNRLPFDLPPPGDFDEAKYLSINSDVAEACRNGKFRSGYEHYVKHGRAENRPRPDRPGGSGAGLPPS